MMHNVHPYIIVGDGGGGELRWVLAENSYIRQRPLRKARRTDWFTWFATRDSIEVLWLWHEGMWAWMSQNLGGWYLEACSGA